MRVRVLILGAILALSGAASAQSVELTIEESPEDQQITAGESVDLPFTANFTAQEMTCLEDVAVPGNATGEASVQGSSPPGASHEIQGQELSFTIPAGSSEHTETQDATVTLATEGGVSQNYTATVTLTAETGAVPAEEACPTHEIPAGSDSVSVSVDVVADEPPEDDTDDQDDGPDTVGNETDGNETDDEPEEEENGLPLPASLVPPALLSAALLLGARRREG